MRPSLLPSLAAVLLIIPSPAGAQELGLPAGGEPEKPTPTFVEVELLISSSAAGLRAQLWRTILEPLDVALRVRQPTRKDKPEIKEREIGSLRRVTAVGRLERDGSITFPDRTFDLEDVERLTEWINDLKTYGAQGKPEGQPLWGLSKPQFDALYEALSQPLEARSAGIILEEAIARLKLPDEYRVRFKTAAQAVLTAQQPPPRVRDELIGFSKATALAVMLNQYGLGFRPSRTPAGSIEVAVVPLDDEELLWPVGWPPELPRYKVAPKLFTLESIELTEIELVDVLDAVEDLTGVPIFLDHHQIEKEQIDLAEIKVSHPARQAAWSRALRVMTFQARLSSDLWTDEAGRPFVWVTTLRAKRRMTQRPE